MRQKPNYQAGEIVQWVRAYVRAIADDLASSTLGSSQPLITSVPGDLSPSSGLHRYLCNKVHIKLTQAHTHIIINILFSKIKLTKREHLGSKKCPELGSGGARF